jgi:hypothetical protein
MRVEHCVRQYLQSCEYVVAAVYGAILTTAQLHCYGMLGLSCMQLFLHAAHGYGSRDDDHWLPLQLCTRRPTATSRQLA